MFLKQLLLSHNNLLLFFQIATEKEYKRKKIARLVMIIATFLFGMCIILVGGTLAMSEDIDEKGKIV